MVVVAVVVPEVPVIVTFEVPTVAVALAVKVITLVLVVGLVANAAVTPAGNPVAARVTLPVKVPVSVTVMVSLAVLPCVTDNAAGDAASVKPDTGVAVTVSEMEVEAVSVPEVPVMATGCRLVQFRTARRRGLYFGYDCTPYSRLRHAFLRKI